MKKIFVLVFMMGVLYGMSLATPTYIIIKVKQTEKENKKIRPSSFLMNVLGFYDAEARKLTLSFLQDIGQANVSLYDKAGTVVYSQLINTGGIRVQTFLLPGKAGTYTFSIVSDNYVGTGEIVL